MSAPPPPTDAVRLALSPESFLPGLALALAIGLLIGIERGWQLREEPAGSRVAGVRTFAVMGLLGGVAGLPVEPPLRQILIVLMIAAAAAVVVGYFLDARRDGNVSATSALASVFTLALGACASAGYMAVAAVGAGVAVLLLASREPLHHALLETSRNDIRALVRLALVVFVILPLLPDAPLGPYHINPRRVWTVVVITGSISFIGYVLMRVLGSRGILLTAVVGALVSSTAVTLECARRIRADEEVKSNQTGIAVASTIMMVRACVLVALLTPYILSAFLYLLIPALLVSAGISALLLFRGGNEEAPFDKSAVKAPDLKLALLFGALVAVMALAAAWAEQQMKGSGAAVVAIGGLFDVDSAIAALGTIPPNTLSVQLASFAVAAPIIFNSFLKLTLTLAVVRKRSAVLPSVALGLPAVVILTSIAIAVV